MPPGKVDVLVVCSYGFLTSPRGHGSIARIQDAIDLMRQGHIPSSVLMLWPQGYGKLHPSLKLMRGESLGQNLAEYCRRQPELGGSRIISAAMSWGTRNDIASCYKLVANLHPGLRARFYFVSDPAHLKRVKLTWDLTHPEGWNAEFFEATNHQLPWKERVVREFVARMWYKIVLRFNLITEGRLDPEDFRRAYV